MTLFEKIIQEQQIQRINNLSNTSQRKWGKMTVSQMLAHMSIAFAVPINKIQLPKDKLYFIASNPVAHFLMINLMSKWPKNMATVDAYKVEKDVDFEDSKRDFLENFNAFLTSNSFDGCHPAFGKMSKAQWGKAMYIHLDHHLQQFGV